LIISAGIALRPPESANVIFDSLLSTASARKPLNGAAIRLARIEKQKKTTVRDTMTKKRPEYPSYPFPPACTPAFNKVRENIAAINNCRSKQQCID